MALSAAYMRLRDNLVGLITVSCHFYSLDQAKQVAMNFCIQFHILAGICQQDPGHGTFLADIRGPVVGRWGVPNQPAFFAFAAPKVISIKVLAFKSGRRTHLSAFPSNKT